MNTTTVTKTELNGKKIITICRKLSEVEIEAIKKRRADIEAKKRKA